MVFTAIIAVNTMRLTSPSFTDNSTVSAAPSRANRSPKVFPIAGGVVDG